MRRFVGVVLVVQLFAGSPLLAAGQRAQGGGNRPDQATASVPRVIRLTGTLTPAGGRSLAQVETITLRLYAQESSETVLWEETQHVMPDAEGRYSVLLGSTRPDGMPLEIFQSGEPRWVGTTLEGVGEKEGPRVRLVSVPYALRAADADTLGGVPASAYMRSDDTRANTTAVSGSDAPTAILPGSPGAIAKYAGTEDIAPSALFEVGDRLGFHTLLPRDALHLQFTNTSGGMAGLAVQNMGNTSTSFSGMLFFDHNGVLGQFQGFNNLTHEYRINNIARNGAAQFDGSINFMVGSTSRFLISSSGNIGLSTAPSHRLTLGGETAQFPAALRILPTAHATSERAELQLDGWSLLQDVNGTGAKDFAIHDATANRQRLTITTAGNVGVGTTTPSNGFEVSNALTSNITGNIFATTFSDSFGGSQFLGRKFRGTSAAPLPVVNGDTLAFFGGSGRGTTVLGPNTGSMAVRAAENFTDTARGTLLNFSTTPIGSSTLMPRMMLDPAGNLGIGTTVFFPEGALEVSRTAEDPRLLVTAFDGEPHVITRVAGGAPGAATAVMAGDELGVFGAAGFTGLGFNDVTAGFAVYAAEDWGPTSTGSAMIFATTPLLTQEPVIHMSILPNGFVGIGTPQDLDGAPTATDRLQVFGNIRVGTPDFNGCVMGFDGNPLIGTCTSDGRFKKNVTSFASMLNAVSSLRPVHYDWRTDAFPDRHFSNARSYGLIAQEVEQVMPELVVTGKDGYKAVDYTKLPLLAIQAIKELKSENDALQARLTELERIVKALAAERR